VRPRGGRRDDPPHLELTRKASGREGIFRERLGDHVANKDPVRAAALYRLALVSHQKAASYATSGAEGHMLMADVHRVEGKLTRVMGTLVAK
jgi:hypothetical protein